MIHAFQSFTQAFVVCGGTGGPADSTLFYTLYLYQQGFGSFDMGYASAMAWVLLLIIARASPRSTSSPPSTGSSTMTDTFTPPTRDPHRAPRRAGPTTAPAVAAAVAGPGRCSSTPA